jgi:hypothetical protein
MFHGRFFSSDDQGLDPFVRELDARVALEFPEFLDGTAERRLRLVPDQITGRGVELAKGARVTKDMPLAPYAGRVVLDGPALRPTMFWRYQASAVRAAPGPPPSMPAPSARKWILPLSTRPCWTTPVTTRRCACGARPASSTARCLSLSHSHSALRFRIRLSDGCRLTWDYDGGLRAGNNGFTVDFARSLELRDEGVAGATVPCACQAGRPCPRGRWFRVPPPP